MAPRMAYPAIVSAQTPVASPFQSILTFTPTYHPTVPVSKQKGNWHKAQL